MFQNFEIGSKFLRLDRCYI